MAGSKLFMFFDGGFLAEKKIAHGGIAYAFNSPEKIRFGFGLIMPPEVNTNNKAEYFALNWGLAYLLKRPLPFSEELLTPVEVTILGDSELVIKQLTGEYSVNSAALKNLHGFAMHLLSALKKLPFISEVKVVHIPRHCNKVADFLGRAALKKKYSFEGLLACKEKATCSALQNAQVCSKPVLLSAKRITI